MNPYALAAALIACIVMAVVALAVYGAYTVCRQARGRAQDHGDRRAWQRAAALTAARPLPEQAFLIGAEPLDDTPAGIQTLLDAIHDTQPGTDQAALDTCEQIWRQTPTRAWEEEQ